MPIAVAIEKMLNSANTDDSLIPQEIKLYSKEINIEHPKIQLPMLHELIRTYIESTSIKKVTNL